MKKLLFLFLFVCSTSALAQDYYYKVTTMRATPGKLLELIDMLKEDMKNHNALGMREPFLMRHSQGDHWDLLMIYPIGTTLSAHFTDNAIKKRKASKTQDQPYGSDYYDFISFQEEQIVTGPDFVDFNRRFKQFGYYHVEIFQALAGKQKELLKEREMENVYLKEIKRDDNLIFTKVMGGEADIFTIGFYRDIKHYAESADIPIEEENRAAKVAGFESVYTIGSYLRSLLLEHHDTLAGAVRKD